MSQLQRTELKIAIIQRFIHNQPISTPQNEWFRRGRFLKCYSKKSKKGSQKNAKLINKEKKPKKELEKPVNTENMYGI